MAMGVLILVGVQASRASRAVVGDGDRADRLRDGRGGECPSMSSDGRGGEGCLREEGGECGLSGLCLSRACGYEDGEEYGPCAYGENAYGGGG